MDRLALIFLLAAAWPVLAASPATHPFTAELFDSHGIERIACSPEVLGSMPAGISVDCGRVEQDFRSFRKARPGQRWTRAGRGARRQYLLSGSTPFRLTFREESRELEMAWIADYPTCLEGAPPAHAAATRPEVLIRLDPHYPEKARASRSSGAVLLSAIVDRGGYPTAICVLSATPPNQGFEEAAMHSMRQWRYRPAMVDGKPVTAVVTARVTFTLSGGYVPLADLVAKFFESSRWITKSPAKR